MADDPSDSLALVPLPNSSPPPPPPPPPPPQSRPLPIREDCWSEEASSTLVDVWGRRYLELNRGNLRQKDWQDVADAVNALHGHTKKTYRTDVQCKNRIDTIKKKYKVEKSRLADGTLISSSWPFFDRLNSLIGPNFTSSSSSAVKKPSASPSPSPPIAVPLRRTPAFKYPPTVNVPVLLPQKRPAFEFSRNYSAMAAAAAAADSDSEDEEDEEEEVLVGGAGAGAGAGARAGRESWEEEEEVVDEGIKRLARAIERFGEVYQRVETEKLRQMVDLEKQRMKFAKDLEMERMRIFTETQIHLEKMCSAGEDASIRRKLRLGGDFGLGFCQKPQRLRRLHMNAWIQMEGLLQSRGVFN